jgi:hypothetical protein
MIPFILALLITAVLIGDLIKRSASGIQASKIEVGLVLISTISLVYVALKLLPTLAPA